MGKERRHCRRSSVTLALEHVSAPDALERLRRAFSLILEAAARAEGEVDHPPRSGNQEVPDVE
jgi:hypothetical protein